MLTARRSSPLSGPSGDDLWILVVLVYTLPVALHFLLVDTPASDIYDSGLAPDALSAPIIFYALLCSFLARVRSAGPSQVL